MRIAWDDVIDFLAVLFGYAISGERTLEAFYERLQPFAVPFMALFGRDRLPARSTLSRFLAALTEVIKVNPVLTHFANFDLTHPNTHQCLQERSPPPSLLDAKRPFIR